MFLSLIELENYNVFSAHVIILFRFVINLCQTMLLLIAFSHFHTHFLFNITRIITFLRSFAYLTFSCTSVFRQNKTLWSWLGNNSGIWIWNYIMDYVTGPCGKFFFLWHYYNIIMNLFIIKVSEMIDLLSVRKTRPRGFN